MNKLSKKEIDEYTKLCNMLNPNQLKQLKKYDDACYEYNKTMRNWC